MLLGVLVLGGPKVWSQPLNPLGYPQATHYTTPDGFELHDQTWCTVQDHRGVAYIGDNNGMVYEYDGSSWRRIKTGTSPVLSMAVDSLGFVYVGRDGGFGCLRPNAQGCMDYQPLDTRMPDSLRQSIGRINNVIIHRGLVHFCSTRRIYILGSDGRLTSVALPKNCFFSLKCDENLYVGNFDQGLQRLTDDGQVLIDPHTSGLAGRGVYSMVKLGQDRYWAITSRGIAEYNQRTMTVEPVFDRQGILRKLAATPGAMPYCGGMLSNGNVGVGYIYGDFVSLLELDSSGNLAGIVNSRHANLVGSNVTAMCPNGRGGLWLNFADAKPIQLELHSPIMRFTSQHGIQGNMLGSIVRIDGTLYVASNHGLLKMGTDEHGFAHFYSMMEADAWQIINFVESDGHSIPLVAAFDGIKTLRNGKVQPFLQGSHPDEPNIENLYGMALLQSKAHPERLYIGSNSSLASIEVRRGKAVMNTYRKFINRDGGEIQILTEDHRGNIWVGCTAKYLAMLTPEGRVKYFDGQPEFDLIIRPIALNDSLFALTSKGIMHFSYEDSCFKMGGIAGQRYTGKRIHHMTPYRDGYVICCEQNDTKWVELLERDAQTGQLVSNATPFKGLPNKVTMNMYVEGDILWLGIGEQLFSYNPNVPFDYQQPFNALIRRVSFKDSLVFGGTFTTLLPSGQIAIALHQHPDSALTMPYSHNALDVQLGAPCFGYEHALQYAHYLEGAGERTWSGWSNRAELQYNNLSEGRYTLHIKARNVYGTESTETVFQFRIKPPWYRTIVAYLLYVVAAGLLVWRIVRWNTKRLEAENKRLEGIVQERTAEVVAQKEEIEEQKGMLLEQNREITSSIQYASRIQHTMLSPEEVVKSVFPDSFILYLPRDIVSGDFYVVMQVGNKKISVVADCTGHGVPGGFMSMLGMSSITEIINKNANSLVPSDILFKLRDKVIGSLHQTGEVGTSKDGMDLALYIVDETEMTLEFAGANNSLVLIRDGEVHQLKADKMPIGFYLKGNLPFTNHQMELKKGDCIYTFSDGYADQFGGTDGRKFMSKNLRNLLLEIHQKPMPEQHDILERRLAEWHGASPRIDDVVLMGVRI